MSEKIKNSPLNLGERTIIEVRYRDGCSMRDIAKELDRNASTISREIDGKLRRGIGKYIADIAHRKALKRISKRGNISKIDRYKELKEKYPKCDKPLVLREGRFGKFISCSGYPKCKFIKEDPKEAAKKRTGVKCPKCSDGEMTERNGRFGVFYSCSNYPDCKMAINAKPTGKIYNFKRKDKGDKKCGTLMMEGTKTISERCSDKKCPNSRPDRLEK